MTSLFVLSFIAVMAIGLPPQNSKLNIQHQNADNIIAETRNENGEISPVYESDLIESNSTSTSFSHLILKIIFLLLLFLERMKERFLTKKIIQNFHIELFVSFMLYMILIMME